jgi:hypothetical protein
VGLSLVVCFYIVWEDEAKTRYFSFSLIRYSRMLIDSMYAGDFLFYFNCLSLSYFSSLFFADYLF